MQKKKNGIRKKIKQEIIFTYPLIILLILIGLELTVIAYLYRVPLEGLFKFVVTLDPVVVQRNISAFGAWAPLVFLLIQTVQVVVSPLPGHVLAMAGGLMFGTLEGTLLSILGGFLGSLIAFKLAQKFGRTLIEKLIGKTDFNFFDDFFEQKGPYAVFLLRLMPMLSFDLVSYGMGLTKIKFKDYAFATLLGMIPGTLIYTYLGSRFALNPILLVVSSILAIIFLLLLPAIKSYLLVKKKREVVLQKKRSSHLK